MAETAREEQEVLSERLAKLEVALATLEATPSKSKGRKAKKS